MPGEGLIGLEDTCLICDKHRNITRLAKGIGHGEICALVYSSIVCRCLAYSKAGDVYHPTNV